MTAIIIVINYAAGKLLDGSHFLTLLWCQVIFAVIGALDPPAQKNLSATKKGQRDGWQS
jgi:hypothetical protein